MLERPRNETHQLKDNLTIRLGHLQPDGKEHCSEVDHEKQHTPQDELSLRGVFELREEHVRDEVCPGGPGVKARKSHSGALSHMSRGAATEPGWREH